MAATIVGREFDSARTTVGIVVVSAMIHVGLLAIIPPNPTFGLLAALEGGVLLLYVSAEYASGGTVRSITLLAVAFVAGFAVVSGLRTTVTSLFIVTVLVLGASAIVSYGLHRYELVILGLVEES